MLNLIFDCVNLKIWKCNIFICFLWLKPCFLINKNISKKICMFLCSIFSLNKKHTVDLTWDVIILYLSFAITKYNYEDFNMKS